MGIIKKANQETLTSILIIVIVTIITFGILIPVLGYYRDDWYVMWTGHARGIFDVGTLFTFDRPIMGYFYKMVYRVLGETPIFWHLYAMGLKIAGAILVFWILRMIWPERKYLTLIASILFSLYPGFLQQPNANTFQNQLFSYTVAIFSIASTVQMLRCKSRYAKILWAMASVLSELLYFGLYEYMIGLEGLRLILIFYVIQNNTFRYTKVSMVKALKVYAVYILPMILLVWWRIYFFPSTRMVMNVGLLLENFKANPVENTISVFIEGYKSIINTTLYSWNVPLYQFWRQAPSRDFGISIFMGIMVIGILVAYSKWGDNGQFKTSTNDEKTNIEIMIIGAVTIIATLFPIVVVGRYVKFDSQFDRYTLQSSMGVSLFLTGLLFAFVKDRARNIALFLMIGFSVMTHYLSATYYRDFWSIQKQIWWQLSWRAPSIEEGTIITVNLPKGFEYYEGTEIWGPVNLVYNPDDYDLQIMGQILSDETLDLFTQGVYTGFNFRGNALHMDFDTDYEKLLIIDFPSINSCIHVVDSQRYEYSAASVPLVRVVAPYSKIGLINTEGVVHQPLNDIFGSEPGHVWCYFYQKASLARQQNDWYSAAAYLDQAFNAGLFPQDETEWFLVLESYANVGREDAASRAAEILRLNETLQFGYCDSINSSGSTNTPTTELIKTILCK